MKLTIALLVTLAATVAGAANMTNYPVTTVFDVSTWFLLSSVPNKTNYNLPGIYVASTADLNAASNSIVGKIPDVSGYQPLLGFQAATNGAPLLGDGSYVTNINGYNIQPGTISEDKFDGNTVAWLLSLTSTNGGYPGTNTVGNYAGYATNLHLINPALDASPGNLVSSNVLATATNTLGEALAGQIAVKQSGSSNLTNWSLLSTNAFDSAIASKQLGSLNLTNWSLLSTGALSGYQWGTANGTNWAQLSTNALTAKQIGSANLTNWSQLSTNSIVTAGAITVAINAISDYFKTNKQPASLNLSNWSLFPVSYMTALSNNIYWMMVSNHLANIVTNFTAVDTNGFPVFWASNGVVAVSGGLLSGSATVALLGVDTNSHALGIPQGYAGITNLAVSGGLVLSDTNSVKWRIRVQTDGTLTTSTNL